MSWYGYDYYGYRPYVSVAQRRANAKREMAKLEKKGYKPCPVQPEGRAIAKTFWGRAWCDNLESYSDFSNRLPRGRTYIRNGSVVDLQIEPGKVTARVSGSELYTVKIEIGPVVKNCWSSLKQQCAGKIGSLVELLQGKLSGGVMELVTARDGGLFPKPKEIEMSCSCPDYAGMCKHIAAVLYGVGTRLDGEPELLFKLRKVDHLELITEAGNAAALPAKAAGKAGKKTLAAGDLADVFGIELDESAAMPATPPAPAAPAAEASPAASPTPAAKKSAKPAKSTKPAKSVRTAAAPAKPGSSARAAKGRKDTAPVPKPTARGRARPNKAASH